VIYLAVGLALLALAISLVAYAHSRYAERALNEMIRALAQPGPQREEVEDPRLRTL
jgi:hypothetical protein